MYKVQAVVFLLFLLTGVEAVARFAPACQKYSVKERELKEICEKYDNSHIEEVDNIGKLSKNTLYIVRNPKQLIYAPLEIPSGAAVIPDHGQTINFEFEGTSKNGISYSGFVRMESNSHLGGFILDVTNNPNLPNGSVLIDVHGGNVSVRSGSIVGRPYVNSLIYQSFYAQKTAANLYRQLRLRLNGTLWGINAISTQPIYNRRARTTQIKIDDCRIHVDNAKSYDLTGIKIENMAGLVTRNHFILSPGLSLVTGMWSNGPKMLEESNVYDVSPDVPSRSPTGTVGAKYDLYSGAAVYLVANRYSEDLDSAYYGGDVRLYVKSDQKTFTPVEISTNSTLVDDIASGAGVFTGTAAALPGICKTYQEHTFEPGEFPLMVRDDPDEKFFYVERAAVELERFLMSNLTIPDVIQPREIVAWSVSGVLFMGLSLTSAILCKMYKNQRNGYQAIN